jgi:hypothetical protein
MYIHIYICVSISMCIHFKRHQCRVSHDIKPGYIYINSYICIYIFMYICISTCMSINWRHHQCHASHDIKPVYIYTCKYIYIHIYIHEFILLNRHTLLNKPNVASIAKDNLYVFKFSYIEILKTPSVPCITRYKTYNLYIYIYIYIYMLKYAYPSE